MEKSKSLIQFETLRDKIKACTTNEELDKVVNDGFDMASDAGFALTEGQQANLKVVIDSQRQLIRLQGDYTKVDEQNFTEPVGVEVVLPEVHPTMEPQGEIIQSVSEAEPKKRTRRTRDEMNAIETVVPTSYKVSRRVNRPIDGVQYSNNEYVVEVTSTDKETLLIELNTLQETLANDLNLYTKEAVTKLRDEAYTKGKAEATKIKTVPVGAPAFQYDMKIGVGLDAQYTLARYQRLEACVRQMFEEVPGSKEFYTDFANKNPAVPPPSL